MRSIKNHPSGGTKEDVFEQFVSFTLSEQCSILRTLIDPLAAEVQSVFGNLDLS